MDNGLIRHGVKAVRRVVVAVVGTTVVLVGLALFFLPGPALVVIPIGLGILAVEFAWARRWLHRAHSIYADAVSGGGPEEEAGPQTASSHPSVETESSGRGA